MNTTPKFESREIALKQSFNIENLKDVWRNKVRLQLRNVDILDLFDYYDFNYLISTKSKIICDEILTGVYRPKQPIIYKLEKKMGVCRHVVIPSPSDALVLQIISDSIHKKVLKLQPSKKAFYSRDRTPRKQPHEFDGAQSFDLAIGWRKFQKKIYEYQDTFEFICVTDLSTYFDSIDLKLLKQQVLSALDDNDRAFVDLLFEIIHQIKWRPDYIERKDFGLPMVNLEGIRLLAHLFLFDIDSILKKKTGDSFVRWMDDINFGVNTKEAGFNLFNDLSDVLKSIGLSLNLSKTNIYDKKTAKFEFEIEQHLYLTKIQEKIGEGELSSSEFKRVKNKFKNHCNQKKRSKSWRKITKRYITQFTKYQADIPKALVKGLFNEEPGLRTHIIYYLEERGYSEKNKEILLDIAKSPNRYDDVTLFALCNLVTLWEVPDNDSGKKFIEDFESTLIPLTTDLDFYCQLWLKAKYSHPQKLWDFIEKFRRKWEKTAFLRRQITATLPRIWIWDKAIAEKEIANQLNSGIPDVISIAELFNEFKRLKELDQSLSLYLFNHKRKKFRVNHFLVLSSMLFNEQISNRQFFKDSVKKYVKDPFYLKWINIRIDL
ncbi:hypothetical protein BKI52_43995 [marine bacterium AO1-C]|nr:hypothetical protein BKI52_43995 [marine bacterium AO1-C]